MLNITHYQRNANQNYNEVPFHAREWLWSKSLQAINAEEGVEKREPSYTVGEMQTSTATMDSSVEIPWKTGNRTAIWPSNSTAGHHTKETRIEKDTCTPMFISALFIIARTWKQPRCPSAEWIRKLCYIYTTEYYSAIKKNAFESVLMRRMKLEPIIQSEVSQKEKHQYSILTHIYGI